VNFSDVVKKNKNMQKAFEATMSLALESFMPRYIEYCMNMDIPNKIKEAKEFVENHFNKIIIAPRIINNMAVMVFGLELFKDFANNNKIAVPDIDFISLLDNQLEQITGSKIGFVKSAVDQLIEELAVMASNKKILSGEDYRIAKINDKSGTSVEVLAINFTKIYPEFKK